MAATPEQLFQRLGELGIAHETTRHPALHTMAESQAIRGRIPGARNKNRYLRDKKKRNWLIRALENKDISLGALADRIGAARLSFDSPERLYEFLGVKPGSVTALALINDPESKSMWFWTAPCWPTKWSTFTL